MGLGVLSGLGVVASCQAKVCCKFWMSIQWAKLMSPKASTGSQLCHSTHQLAALVSFCSRTHAHAHAHTWYSHHLQAAGDEGRVEVVLVNPLALPLKIDQLTLAVEEAPPTGETKPSMEGVMAGSGPKGDDAPDSSRQSPQRQRQAAGGGGDGARTTTGSDSGEDAGAVVLSPVSVTLPGGGKPVKVQLPLTAKRAGDLLITGVRVTCWGVTWQQPPTLMPRLAPLTAPGALRPQPPQRVLVLAQLPLLRATLTGGDVQVVQPPHDLEGRGGAGAGGVGAGGTGAAAGGGQHASGGGAGGTAAGGGGSGGLGKPTSIPVFEGQHLTWTLTLANVSEHPVGSCSLSVVNAKGAAVRALPQGAQLPASFVGVHVEASGADAALRPAMPLEPRRSVALPLSLVVGRPPADSFEEVMLEVRGDGAQWGMGGGGGCWGAVRVRVGGCRAASGSAAQFRICVRPLRSTNSMQDSCKLVLAGA